MCNVICLRNESDKMIFIKDYGRDSTRTIFSRRLTFWCDCYRTIMYSELCDRVALTLPTFEH